MWSTVSQGQQESHPTSRMSRGDSIKMRREEETEPHKKKDQEEETEDTHPREEETEKAIIQEFASI